MQFFYFFTPLTKLPFSHTKSLILLKSLSLSPSLSLSISVCLSFLLSLLVCPSLCACRSLCVCVFPSLFQSFSAFPSLLSREATVPSTVPLSLTHTHPHTLSFFSFGRCTFLSFNGLRNRPVGVVPFCTLWLRPHNIIFFLFFTLRLPQ